MMMTMTTINSQTLTERQKGLAACACLMAQGELVRLEPAVRAALDNGVTVNELKEAFSQLYAYTGFPRSLNALGVLSKVLENKAANWQEGKPWTRPAEWDDARKAYELGTKNHKQVQVLICVAGRGWYQEWGKEPIPMTPGTVIAVPAEVKHWHGAQKDSWFQHLTYHKDVQEGASNEWLEASPQIVH